MRYDAENDMVLDGTSMPYLAPALVLALTRPAGTFFPSYIFTWQYFPLPKSHGLTDMVRALSRADSQISPNST